jgi:indolepyruvate ferredoxin oxidoreductase beta subunit
MKFNKRPFNLIICGVGGQGNILISRLLGRALSGKGYFVTIGETFGAAQRGGAVFSSIRISQHSFCGPLIPAGHANVVLSLEPLEALRILENYGNPDVITLSNLQPIYPVAVLSGKAVYHGIDKLKSAIQCLSKKSFFLNATKKAMELKEPIVTNIIMIGALIGMKALPLDMADIEKEIRKSFLPSKIDINLKAVSAGASETSAI